MKQVRIAELKAKLSEHLRSVRNGETIAVLDRDTPVAHIVPVPAKPALRIRKPRINRRLGDIPLPPPADIDFDIVELLLEDRQKR